MTMDHVLKARVDTLKALRAAVALATKELGGVCGEMKLLIAQSRSVGKAQEIDAWLDQADMDEMEVERILDELQRALSAVKQS